MKEYKAQLRIPTEMYAYIEVSVEGTAESIVEAYQDFTRLVKPKEGLSEKDFSAHLDRMLLGSDNHVEEYQMMSDKQKEIVQTLKRSLKRLKARNDKNNPVD